MSKAMLSENIPEVKVSFQFPGNFSMEIARNIEKSLVLLVKRFTFAVSTFSYLLSLVGDTTNNTIK